eukprot:CAMPEP_0206328156 /NCGR_PEP_ID=MMETSP0106_2-20121207/22530_1 /ASSEMBLY_ACC=CAM_ASM_000206 /TAXON_ID=81532 /ORGANISM="Acanthoeca-like sp., Strain 10tr" /LENGTH=370 /DNA_ID=CAMNT_0053760819 /DNA_START=1 /DNA_END=1110 /DNA_ORIENTATION=+
MHRQPDARKTVPEVFFRQDFDIGQPETFEQVLDPSSLDAAKAGKMVNRFAEYLDTVENELICTLSSRSDKFFAALTEQQVLHRQVVHALDDVRDVRAQLADAQREAADDDLRFLQLLAARDNAYTLYQRLGTLHTVGQTPATIQLLMTTGDFVEALDLIATELSGLHCLKHFVSQLHGMEDVVHTMMRQEFVNSLLDELGAVPGAVTTAGAAPLRVLADRHVSIDLDADEKCDRMRALLSGITRQQKFDFTAPYRKAVLGVMQDVIKQQQTRKIGAPEPGAGADGGAIRLRQVSFDEWIALLELLLRTLLLLLIQVNSTHQRFAHVLLLIRGEEDGGPADAASPCGPRPGGPDPTAGPVLDRDPIELLED